MDVAEPFRRGDAVRHPGQPGWGVGTVRKADRLTYEGKPAQRLEIVFSNKGKVVVNTGVAPIERAAPPTAGGTVPAEATDRYRKGETMTGRSAGSNGGWLAELERGSGPQTHELWDLPDTLTDPFRSNAERLEAVLSTYRFSTEPRSLIEWAQQQTGLEDPLSKYPRVELEQAFPRFARDRDNFLKDLVRQMKRGGEEQELRRVQNKTQHPPARSAIDRAIRG